MSTSSIDVVHRWRREGGLRLAFRGGRLDVAVGRVTRDGVADLLGGRLLLLGLDGRGDAVDGRLDRVAGLLEVRLLRVGLDSGTELDGEGQCLHGGRGGGD